MPLIEKINAGEFVILGEFEPPKSADFSSLLDKANQIKGRVDALVIPEMGNAVMKASSLGGCAFLERQGFETVFQACCRDRNRLALQSDILSAAALGISNIMVVAGEDIRHGDHPQARAVYDLELEELLQVLQTLQTGRDMVGVELGAAPKFTTGSTVNAGAMGGALDIELEKLQRRIDAGVRFIITSPVFDIHRFQQFVRRVDTGRVAVIPTVMLLKSAGMARYINRNIKNISIPDPIIRDIQKAPDKHRQCVKLAAGLVGDLKKMGMSGVMLSTLGWEDKLPQILDQARL
ncbi:MAG: methylenetetrahydrofolate reductase [Desulfatiglans sp.]|jgi:5,10-methylenetetrahydrofolate reductase|nr:methylenetetrahydrofolate reductase [Desulfatiglans sp.]